MCQKWRKNRIIRGTWLGFFFTILLVLGIFFRFVNLEQKPYWGDEMATTYRVAGYYPSEYMKVALQGNEMSVEEVLKYQRLSPERDFGDTIETMSIPQLYYLIARFWMQLLSGEVTPRFTSALMSLLVFPGIYWLCLELMDGDHFTIELGNSYERCGLTRNSTRAFMPLLCYSDFAHNFCQQ